MHSIFKVLPFLLLYKFVFTQVCNETRNIFREVPETFKFTFIETYEEPHLIFSSVKTRKSANITTRIVQRYETVTVNVCCEGYVEDDNHDGYGLYCEPVCNPPCENGYCRKPNQCSCDPGYALDPLHHHICKPLCLEDCRAPDCISTRIPQCFHNSSSILKKESSICSKPCVNSVCVGTNICQCFPGYHQKSEHLCVPNDSTIKCEHGILISPDTCLCDKGWQWKCGSCQPICDDCDFGSCVLPGQCICNQGYAMEKGKCQPQCSNRCSNGRCIHPEICNCNVGWYKTKEGECKPHCDMNCEHGKCIAPNMCECQVGYQLYIDKNIPLSICLPNHKDCEGSSDPENCKCEAPYEIVYFAENGGNCDCIGACLNTTNICTKASCLYMNVAFDMFPPESDEIDDKSEHYPVLDKPSNVDKGGASTDPSIEATTEKVLDVFTPPVLDYDYDSYEEEDQSYDVDQGSTNKTPNFNHESEKETTGTENPLSKDATQSMWEVNDYIMNRDFQNNPNSAKNPNIRNKEASTETKDVTENLNVNKTSLKVSKESEQFELYAFWMAGVVIIILLIILGIIVKRRCYKNHALNSSDKNGDIAMHYKPNKNI